MAELKFPLGTGPLGTALVVAALLGAGAYFGYAGWADLGEPVLVGEREVAGPAEMRIVFYALAALMGGAGLALLIRALRNIGREKSVTLDPNRLILSGWDIDGAEQVIFYAEVTRLLEYKVRGMPVIEVTPRGGGRIMFSAVLFRSTAAFSEFRNELLRRVSSRD